MLFALSATGFAASHATEVRIPRSHPTHLGIPESTPFSMGRLVFQSSEPDQVVASTDPRVTCRIDDGQASVSFSASASEWPDRLPIVTQCTLGGETLDVRVVKMSRATDLSLQAGSIVDDRVVFTKVRGSVQQRVYALPEGRYATGEVAATLPGVVCRVTPSGGGFVVQVESSSDASNGKGACELPRERGTYRLGLEIDAARI
ncbi:MAG: hypothetical protein R3F61_23335 [Myxococcota bacterium]